MKIKSLFIHTVLVAVITATAAGQDHKGPRISVAEPRYDLGKVVQGAQASHVFEIKNTGDQTLVIEKVQPG